jgi:hypothetical protein
VNEVRVWKVGLMHLHKVDVYEKRLVGRFGRLVKELHARALHVLVQKRDADPSLIRRVHVFAIDVEILIRRFSNLA